MHISYKLCISLFVHFAFFFFCVCAERYSTGNTSQDSQHSNLLQTCVRVFGCVLKNTPIVITLSAVRSVVPLFFTIVLYPHQGIFSIYTNSSVLKLFSLWAKVFPHTNLPGNGSVPVGRYVSFGGAWHLHIQGIFIKNAVKTFKSLINSKLVRLYYFSLIASYYKCGVTGLQQLPTVCVMMHFSLLRVLLFFLINEIIFTLLFRLPKTIEADQLLELQ